MRFANLAAFVEVSEIACSRPRSSIGAGVHDARIECAWAATQRVKGKSSRDIGRIGKSIGLEQSKAQQRQHPLRTIQKGESFLGFQSHRRNARTLHRNATGKFLAL